MKFKIILNPNPAAEYFTVREHLRLFDQSNVDLEELILSIEQNLQKFIKIPSGYRSVLLKKSHLDNFLSKSELIIKDNPETGIDLMKEANIGWNANTILDCSYSFPHFPAILTGPVIIDPSLSFGIPGELALFISKQEFSINQNLSVGKEDIESVYALAKVLNDFLAKGIDVLIRESNYKAAVLYQMIEQSAKLKPVTDKSTRSNSIILAESEPSFHNEIEKLGYEIGLVANNKSALVIGNYPTHSKELIEMFADRVLAI